MIGDTVEAELAATPGCNETDTAHTEPGTAMSSRRRWPRHAFVTGSGLVIGYLFWWTRPEWDPEMLLWKAVGDTTYVLSLAAMAVGPLARFTRRASPWLRWRRQLGIWFALTATLHAVLILNGWAHWGYAASSATSSSPPARA